MNKFQSQVFFEYGKSKMTNATLEHVNITVSDPDQTDTDGDNTGDECDFDDDNDGVCDGEAAVASVCTAGPDNCPLDANPDPTATDGDGAGDACDGDSDGEGVPDDVDACPMTVTGELVDADGCSVADLCPCDNEWKNHGAYVRCVTHATNAQFAAGLITGAEQGAIDSAAGSSNWGKKN